MATVQVSSTPITINGSNTYVLGSASGDDENGGFLVQIVDDNSLSASISVSAQSTAIRASGASDSFASIKYRGGNVNGTAADWSYVSTAITTNSMLWIPAPSGMIVALVVTFTSGSATLYAQPSRGANSF